MLDLSLENLAHSNIFNFAVMVIFFVVLALKLKLPEGIESDRANVQKNIDDSDKEKSDAIAGFRKVEKSLESLPQELDEILKNADTAAKAYEAKAKDEIDKLVASIKENAQKQVDAEQKFAQSSLMKNVAKSSVAIANKQVKKAFDANIELHRKYINDFINGIEKLEI